MRRVITVLATVPLLLGLLGTAPAAAAVKIDYEVTGTDTIKKTGSALHLGPGRLNTELEASTGAITGSLTLPPVRTTFTALGFLPVAAKVEFIPVGKTTGKIVAGVVTSRSELRVKLSDVTVGGFPALVGDSCQSRTPMVVDLTSEPGFSPVRGGKLSGTHELPPFGGCFLAEVLINLLVPGPDNVLSLELKRITG
ncbi:hypothetical protein GCM10022247_03320 [Allokutzneria multivorans]|uniref:Lipid/polyisoprenoid-binding YceI-like domain-containing protein n=1 Tax=Allokutzneria multivorans TaxID=1142134 RepID=A0ABP7QVY9_9PSEU